VATKAARPPPTSPSWPGGRIPTCPTTNGGTRDVSEEDVD
jgi:hypothetical protein